MPAILEYLPYRKRDGTADRDRTTTATSPAHGYACVRVDMRGTGDSDGVLTTNTPSRSSDDGCEVIAWIAAQPWCTGGVGMMGISWGGFNGLQIAARRPPALKAIVTVCSTDDRYADDIHYMGGCLLNDNLVGPPTMFAFNTCPPDPELVGERWRDMWLAAPRGQRALARHLAAAPAARRLLAPRLGLRGLRAPSAARSSRRRLGRRLHRTRSSACSRTSTCPRRG